MKIDEIIKARQIEAECSDRIKEVLEEFDCNLKVKRNIREESGYDIMSYEVGVVKNGSNGYGGLKYIANDEQES